MGIRVDRCLCHKVTFADLKAVADLHCIVDFQELQQRKAYGSGCGLCLPYVKRMLCTGEVVFHELIEAEGGGTRKP